MSFELKNPKGCYDFMPPKMAVRNWIISVLKKHFERYAFLPLETATLCSYDLLSYKYAGGAEILKETYKLRDQGGRNLGLRYDLTVPFCKVIGQNPSMPLPFRRYEIGKVFRDGPIKAGRNREFYQCDVDVVGLAGQCVEAEFMRMIKDVFCELGIDIYIEYNNRKYLNALIALSGIPEQLATEVIAEVDKYKKTSREEVMSGIIEQAKQKGVAIDKASVERLFDYFEVDPESLREEFITKGISLEGLDELSALAKYIGYFDVQDICVFAPYLARGLGIYTGGVWEIYDKQKRVSGSLGAGGRYDKIITSFIDNGMQYPAVGMCFGLEPICVVMESMVDKTQGFVDFSIISMGEDGHAAYVASKVRALGYKAMLDTSKFKKAINYANNQRVNYIIVVGSNEAATGKYQVKNMYNGKTAELTDFEKLAEVTRVTNDE